MLWRMWLQHVGSSLVVSESHLVIQPDSSDSYLVNLSVFSHLTPALFYDPCMAPAQNRFLVASGSTQLCLSVHQQGTVVGSQLVRLTC